MIKEREKQGRQPSGYYEFGQFSFDGSVLSGPVGTIALTPTEAGLLLMLLQAGSSTVSADALLDHVWEGRAVGLESLARCISTLRAKLGGGRDEFIQTLSRRGYRIAVDVRMTGSDASTRAQLMAQVRTSAALQMLVQVHQRFGSRNDNAYEVSRGMIQTALSGEPDCVALWISLADIHVMELMRIGESPRESRDRILGAAGSALRYAPRAAPALAARGWARATIDGDQEGLVDLQRAIDLDPQDWLARFYRGWALAARGDLTGALDDVRTGVTAMPIGPGLLATLSFLLFCCGRSEEALDLLRTKTTADPLMDVVWSLRGGIAAALGHVDEGLSAAQRACALSENSTFSSVWLAYAQARAGHHDAARETLDGLERTPGRFRLPMLVVPTLMELGNVEEARVAFADAEASGCPYVGLVRHDPRIAALVNA